MLESEYIGKIISSDTADKDIKELRDINEALKSVEYVILTSKVTCGCDHTNNKDSFVIDAGGIGRGCTPRDLLQQLGRFRELNDPEVLTLVSSHKDNRTCSGQFAFSAVMEELTNRRTLLQTKYANLLAFDADNREGDLVLSPD